LKTLIVEDDFTSRVLLQELLQGYGIVHVAVNGWEAVEAFSAALDKQDPYDLVCMDILLPEIDGQQAIKDIRAVEDRLAIAPSRRVKIMMTTALGDMKNVSSAYQNMCDAYLTKPIHKQKLISELNRLGLAA
jgi:two-component system, chemotaxis family, chemotaxis protein CheY